MKSFLSDMLTLPFIFILPSTIEYFVNFTAPQAGFMVLFHPAGAISSSYWSISRERIREAVIQSLFGKAGYAGNPSVPLFGDVHQFFPVRPFSHPQGAEMHHHLQNP